MTVGAELAIDVSRWLVSYVTVMLDTMHSSVRHAPTWPIVAVMPGCVGASHVSSISSGSGQARFQAIDLQYWVGKESQQVAQWEHSGRDGDILAANGR